MCANAGRPQPGVQVFKRENCDNSSGVLRGRAAGVGHSDAVQFTGRIAPAVATIDVGDAWGRGLRSRGSV